MGAGGSSQLHGSCEMALTVHQDPRTLSILLHTRPPNTPWAGTRAAAKSTTRLQQVRKFNDLATWNND